MYKAPNGNWYTESLFYEQWINLPIERRVKDPVFSFTEGRPNLICFKKTFVELSDPTGYEWAMKYLESWDHWLRLLKSDWFEVQYRSALDELHMKLKAQALRRISEIQTSNNEGQALAASKYLAERGWDKATRGRPSKEEVTGEMKKLTRIAEETNEDYDRLGLTLIKGGKK